MQKKPRIFEEIDDWGDEDDSGWDDEINFLNEKENKCELVWADNAHLEQKNVDLTLLEKLRNQHILINMDPAALSQRNHQNINAHE